MELFSPPILSGDRHKEAQERHLARLLPFLEAHRSRQNSGEVHPVYDFLFSYYSFSGGQLLRWTPGLQWIVESSTEQKPDWPDHSQFEAGRFWIDPKFFPRRRLPFLHWAIRFLEATLSRPPVFHCFGLHEWAMLYKADTSLYPHIPLRVTPRELEEVVTEIPIRCTHYDAYRFFTPEARPLNRFQPGQKSVTEFDQPGCIHAIMDLYRLAYKIAPYVHSDLLVDLFFLAKDAREIDMRASPYNLQSYGFEPIPVEQKTGRELYVELQKELSRRGLAFRAELLTVYRRLRDAVEDPG